MQTKLGNKIALTLEQRLAMVKRINEIFEKEHIKVTVDWDVTLDFPVVEPAKAVSSLSKQGRIDRKSVV